MKERGWEQEWKSGSALLLFFHFGEKAIQVLAEWFSVHRHVLSAGSSTIHFVGSDRNVIMWHMTVYFEDFTSMFMRAICL